MRSNLPCAAFIALVIAAGPAGAVGSRTVKLALKRPDAAAAARPALSPALAAGPVALRVVDARGAADPLIVGAHRAKGADVYVWRSSVPVDEAVRASAEETLAGWSVKLAPETETTLTLSLARFEVVERAVTFGSSYEAKVSLRASLAPRGGEPAWTSEATGESTRSGVDGRGSMCNEALGLAFRNALAQVVGAAEGVPPAAVAAAPAAVDPDAMYRELLRLKEGGVATEILVSYVTERTLTRPLTVDEILRWKNAGIPDEAIKAATAKRTDR